MGQYERLFKYEEEKRFNFKLIGFVVVGVFWDRLLDIFSIEDFFFMGVSIVVFKVNIVWGFNRFGKC